MRVVRVIDDLPAGFELMRAEARAEGYRHVERLAVDWALHAMRFDGAGEGLLAAYVEETLAGIGGVTIDPVMPGVFRMRRFYVRPQYRHRGIGGRMTLALIQQVHHLARPVTVNAGTSDAPAFWERLGFVPDPRDGHTHILHHPR